MCPQVILFIYQLHWVLVAPCSLSLVAARGGYTLIAMHGLLMAVASLVAKHVLTWASLVVACGLNSWGALGLVALWYTGC